MNKYIDAERMKAEIERHIKEVKAAENRFHPNLGFFDAKLSGIYDTLSIIDSLQQEQPSLPSNLDEAAKQLYPIITEEAKSDEWKIANREYNDMCIKLQDAFRKGAEWIARQMKQEQSECNANISKTLDELMEEVKRYYSDNYAYITSDQPTLSILTNIARHFAEWGAIHFNILKEESK